MMTGGIRLGEPHFSRPPALFSHSFPSNSSSPLPFDSEGPPTPAVAKYGGEEAGAVEGHQGGAGGGGLGEELWEEGFIDEVQKVLTSEEETTRAVSQLASLGKLPKPRS